MQTRSVTYASTNEVAERSVGWNSWSGLSSASSFPPAARKFLVTSNIFNCTTSAFNIRFISVAHVSEMYMNVASFLYFFFPKKQVKQKCQRNYFSRLQANKIHSFNTVECKLERTRRWGGDGVPPTVSSCLQKECTVDEADRGGGVGQNCYLPVCLAATLCRPQAGT